MTSVTGVVAVDVGGTFTDCVSFRDGSISVAKVATTPDQSDGVLEGVRRLVSRSMAAALLHGTTAATNALLERRGADTVLVTDPGFEDVIEIGRQDRPSLYDVFVDRSSPLVAREDRWGLDDPDLVARRVSERRPEAVAVALAYSFSDPSAEEAIADALAGSGIPVSLSHRVVGEFREFERTSTTVLNAYLQPRVGRYLQSLGEKIGDVAERLHVMRSSGGLMPVDEAAGLAAALLLSGPAGGVVAAAEMGRAHGYRSLITFDMGGTSTDVCRIDDGRPEIVYERAIDGYVCRMPSVGVHTVGAGGGSIAWLDQGGSLRVGPHSAGADPGPASYGNGGTEPTVTDAHVVLGRIDPAARLGGSLALHPALAEEALARLGGAMGMDPRRAAAGVLEVVEAHMERAIRRVSVEQGADPRRATLVSFGGAGGLHASALARRLDMAAVAIPPYGGVFSALGLLMAPPRTDVARSALVTDGQRFRQMADEVSRQVAADFAATHGAAPVSVERRVDMRYVGQAHEIPVPVADGEAFDAVVDRFHAMHRELNGFARPDDPVEAVTFRATAVGRAQLTWSDLPTVADGPIPEPRRRSVVFGGVEQTAAVWRRHDLPAGSEITGPAVIEEEVGTTVLAPGDRATVLPDGTIEVTW
ncbi:MAG: hydantoinase/oxoprolinase family protein [Actinomycetes bacterium]